MEEEKKITATSVGEKDGEKTYICEKCGKEHKESEGNFVLEGSAFCCSECCPVKGEHKKEEGETCEFC